MRVYDCAQVACFAVLSLRSGRLQGFQAGSYTFVAASSRVRIARRGGHAIKTTIQQHLSRSFRITVSCSHLWPVCVRTLSLTVFWRRAAVRVFATRRAARGLSIPVLKQIQRVFCIASVRESEISCLGVLVRARHMAGSQAAPKLIVISG